MVEIMMIIDENAGSDDERSEVALVFSLVYHIHHIHTADFL